MNATNREPPNLRKADVCDNCIFHDVAEYGMSLICTKHNTGLSENVVCDDYEAEVSDVLPSQMVD